MAIFDSYVSHYQRVYQNSTVNMFEVVCNYQPIVA